MIRLQLWLTDYPSLSGGKLHIAHLLYGGVLMVLSIWLLTSYVGRARYMPATILGGMGFGFFIDEVGKFVTQDNDYFFKPTATIIYCVFIALYLISRWAVRRPLTREERLANAALLAAERYGRGMTPRSRQAAIALLAPLDGDADAQAMLETLEDTAPTAQDRHGRLEGLVLWMQRTYARLAGDTRFRRLVIALVAIGVVVNLVGLVVLLFGTSGPSSHLAPHHGVDGLSHLTVANIATLVSSAISTLFAALGVYELVRGRRLIAFQRIRQALLVSIFVTYPFIFAESSFSATTGLLVTLAAFGTVSAMLREEERLELEPAAGQQAMRPSAAR
ncbi:MAG: hypothetical protein F2832_02655 [Actinobacteria bacterium]|nr:hypothetical protein [Actinomycetota bacterium]